MMNPRFYPVSQFAKLLLVGESTVRRMINDGQLKAVMIRERLRIPASELERLEEEAECTIGSSQEARMESGNSAGPRIGSSEPEALAREMKQRHGSNLISLRPK